VSNRSNLVFFIGCMCDHNRQQTMPFTWFTLSASAMSAIFVLLVGFKVGKVLPEMESTNSLLMNNCNRKKNYLWITNTKQTSIIVKFLFALPEVISSYGEWIRAEENNHVLHNTKFIFIQRHYSTWCHMC